MFASVILYLMWSSLFMLETQTKPMDETRIKTIMRNHPRLGRSLACSVSFPTILYPKKSKMESCAQGNGDMLVESLFSEGNELHAEPLQSSSTPLHDTSTMKVLLTYLVWNCSSKRLLYHIFGPTIPIDCAYKMCWLGSGKSR